MKAIHATGAPGAIGPYVHAVQTGNLIYCSGQTPIDPSTMRVEHKDISNQARQVFANLKAVLSAANASTGDVVKVNVYLTDMKNFHAMNAVYAEFFGDHKPARTTVAVAGLPLESLIEIECIAEVK